MSTTDRAKGPSSGRGPLLKFYADDFTGATDAMEVMHRRGYPTVLFLDPPSPDQLSRFSNATVVGVAGTSRSWSKKEIEAKLPSILSALDALPGNLLHYKWTFALSRWVRRLVRACR